MENYRAKQSKGDETSSSSSSSSSSSLLLLPSPNTSLHSHLSHDQRVSIIALHEADHSDEDISQRMHRSERAIKHWISEFPNNPTLSDHPRSGAPSKLTDQQQSSIVRRAEDDPFIVPKMIKSEQKLDCSASTVDRLLIKKNLFGRIAKNEPNYSENQLQAWVAFGRAFSHWTKEQWERVIFTDATSFNLGMNNNRIYVRRPPSEAYNPKYMWKDEGKATSGAGGVTIKVWTGFAASGRLSLGFYDGSLDGKTYIQLINQHLLPSARRLFPSGQWYVLHDNDRPWKGDDVQRHLHNKGIPLLPFPWPSYSSDLNPVENLRG